LQKNDGAVTDAVRDVHGQDERLKAQLQESQQRLKGLDIEDLDAEREQLALTEHILEKLAHPPPMPDDAAAAARANECGARSGDGRAPGEGNTAETGPPLLVGPP
jgi:hypothetical protein